MNKIEKPFINKDDDNGKTNELKWQLFLKDFNIVSSWKWLDNHKGFTSRKGIRKGFEIFDYHERFKDMSLLLFDHVTGWETKDWKYIAVSQPYLNFLYLDEVFKRIVSNRDFWQLCLDYNYSIDIYFTNKYNWYKKEAAFITFTRNFYVSASKNLQELLVNVHTLDGNNKEIITPYKIKLSISK